MYEAFFRLESRPFPSTPRVDRYFPASTIEDAFRTLSRCVERAEGPGLAIGSPGTGKSLLCELLATRFRDRFHVVKLDSAHLCTRRALLQNILFELNLPFRGMDEGGLRLSLIDFLKPGEAAREGMLLLVDEAHTLTLRLVEEIRMITNLVRDGQSRARLVMVGDTALEEHLANPKLVSLNQRIAARCYLQPLTYEETIEFVRSQIAAVGGKPDRLFTDDAFQAVFHASDGIPRLINQVCDHALILLSNKQGQQLSAGVIEAAWADLQQLPMPMSRDSQPAPPDSNVVEFGSLDDNLLAEDDIDEGTDVVQDDLAAEDVLIGQAEFANEDGRCEPEFMATRDIDLTEQLGVIEHHFQQIESFDASSACEETSLDAGPIDAEPPHAEQLDLLNAEVEEVEQTQPKSPCCDDPSDPFAEPFAHEEPVKDHYTALETAGPTTRPTHRPCREEQASSDSENMSSPPDAVNVEADAANRPAESMPPDRDSVRDESVESLDFAQDVEGEAPEQRELERPVSRVFEDEIARREADETSMRPEIVRARVLRSVPPDDSDLLVVVDDELASDSPENLPERTHRRRYRDLFTRLRES